MELKKGRVLTNKEISQWVGTKNYVSRIKQRNGAKTNKEIDQDISIVFFAKDWGFIEDNELYCQMKKNQWRFDPINDEVIKQGFAHIFTQISFSERRDKFIYHGYRKMINFDKKQNRFIFDLDPKYAKKTKRFIKRYNTRW